MYDYPEELGKLSPELLWSLINVNMSSVTMMTRMLINGMKSRGKGAIVNISSGSELQPLPLAAVYGASKVSLTFFYNFHRLFLAFLPINHRFFFFSHCWHNPCISDLRQEFHTRHSAWIRIVWHFGAIDHTAVCAHQDESLLNNRNKWQHFLSGRWNVHAISCRQLRKNQRNHWLLDSRPSGWFNANYDENLMAANSVRNFGRVFFSFCSMQLSN